MDVVVRRGGVHDAVRYRHDLVIGNVIRAGGAAGKYGNSYIDTTEGVPYVVVLDNVACCGTLNLNADIQVVEHIGAGGRSNSVSSGSGSQQYAYVAGSGLIYGVANDSVGIARDTDAVSSEIPDGVPRIGAHRYAVTANVDANVNVVDLVGIHIRVVRGCGRGEHYTSACGDIMYYVPVGRLADVAGCDGIQIDTRSSSVLHLGIDDGYRGCSIEELESIVVEAIYQDVGERKSAGTIYHNARIYITDIHEAVLGSRGRWVSVNSYIIIGDCNWIRRGSLNHVVRTSIPYSTRPGR